MMILKNFKARDLKSMPKASVKRIIKIIVLRPCSGLVVSEYAKRQKVESVETLIPALYQYKNFKKMFTVDAIGEFEG